MIGSAEQTHRASAAVAGVAVAAASNVLATEQRQQGRGQSVQLLIGERHRKWHTRMRVLVLRTSGIHPWRQ